MEKRRKEILTLLLELKQDGDIFNRMGGALYSAIIADRMTETNYQLWSMYGVKVKYTQPCDGRVEWENLDELIEKYS